MFFLDFSGVAGITGDPVRLIGSSPEMHVMLEDGMAYLHPIAGTRWRGKTAAEDDELAKDLLDDPKERAEHVMLVDLGRNDLGRVCVGGSVRVDEFMMVESYAHVHHIVSNVSGSLRPGDRWRHVALLLPRIGRVVVAGATFPSTQPIVFE